MPSNALIGIAGVHFVVSDLSRRGMIALPTVRNTAGYDIIVSNTDGTQYASIQVKTSLSRVSFFPMPPSAKVHDGENTFYALVRWIEHKKCFECFFLTGQEAKEEVRRGEVFQKKRIEQGTRKVIVPSVYVGQKVAERAKVWQERWLQWQL